MAQYDFDMLVIGGGSGGVRAARWAASLGAKVALCEKEQLGGTCVVRGCVPKKMMVYGSELPHHLKVMESYGWKSGPIEHDWDAFRQIRDNEIKRLSGLYLKTLENNNVTFLMGKGIIQDPHSVQINGKIYSAKYIFVATGGRPVEPPIKGVEHIINSRQFFELKERPKKILIAGGGYIGLEMGSILRGFGSEVDIVLRSGKILRGFDEETTNFLKEQLIQSGIRFHDEVTAEKVEHHAKHLDITLSNGESFQADKMLCAVGRTPNTEGIGLENANVLLEKDGSIKVNDYFQTSCSSIYAVGDVINKINLTPVAIAQAMVVTENLFAGTNQTMDYEAIASAVFSRPEMATVGLSEQQALTRGHKIKVFKSSFRPLKISLTPLQEKTFMKMIVDKQSDRVLGCHMVGEGAGEIMQGVAIALKAKATKKQFDQTIGIHPSSAEEFTTMR